MGRATENEAKPRVSCDFLTRFAATFWLKLAICHCSVKPLAIGGQARTRKHHSKSNQFAQFARWQVRGALLEPLDLSLLICCFFVDHFSHFAFASVPTANLTGPSPIAALCCLSLPVG